MPCHPIVPIDPVEVLINLCEGQQVFHIHNVISMSFIYGRFCPFWPT